MVLFLVKSVLSDYFDYNHPCLDSFLNILEFDRKGYIIDFSLSIIKIVPSWTVFGRIGSPVPVVVVILPYMEYLGHWTTSLFRG